MSYEVSRSLAEQRSQLLDDGFVLAFAAYPDETTGRLDEDALEEAITRLEEEVGEENVAELDGVFGLDGKQKPNLEASSVFVRRPRDVYTDLFAASADDIDQANVYFLGDGITVMVGQSHEAEDAPLRIALLDEQDDKLLNIGVGPESTQVVGIGFNADNVVPTSTVARLRAIKHLTPDDNTFDFEESRQRSLATAVPEGRERWVEGVRSLIHELASPEAPVA